MAKSSLSVFSDIAKFADFQWKNTDVSTIQGVCHMAHIFFGSSLGKVWLPSFTIVRYVWQILGRGGGGGILPPSSMSSLEKAHPE